MKGTIIAAIGSGCLGMLIGWMIRFVWRRIRRFNIKTLSATLSLMLGGVVTNFISPNSKLLWLYVGGLLVGFVLYSIVATIAIRAERHKGEFKGTLYDKE